MPLFHGADSKTYPGPFVVVDISRKSEVFAIFFYYFFYFLPPKFHYVHRNVCIILLIFFFLVGWFVNYSFSFNENT